MWTRTIQRIAQIHIDRNPVEPTELRRNRKIAAVREELNRVHADLAPANQPVPSAGEPLKNVSALRVIQGARTRQPGMR